MKRIKTIKLEQFIAGIAVISLISILIMGLNSCGSNRTAHCDAYGQNDIDNGSISEDEGS